MNPTQLSCRVLKAIASLRAGGVPLVTNYACNLVTEEILDQEDLLRQTRNSAEGIIRSLFRFLEKVI